VLIPYGLQFLCQAGKLTRFAFIPEVEGAPEEFEMARGRKPAGLRYWKDFKVTEISGIEIERILLKKGHRYRIGNDGLLC